MDRNELQPDWMPDWMFDGAVRAVGLALTPALWVFAEAIEYLTRGGYSEYDDSR